MFHLLSSVRTQTQHAVLRNMFEARKRVFVDLLGWDVPVLDGRYELDQFDNERAVYLVVSDADGRHRASARLLPTTSPHILDTLFPSLSDEPIPCGSSTMEITRFCLERAATAAERRAARNELIHALVRYALAHGINRYTGVAELAWLRQILAFGWRSRQLAAPRNIDGQFLGAMVIEIDNETPDLLERGTVPPPSPKQELHRVH